MTSGRGRLAALNLAAVTRWQKHERLGIARLRRLAGARMRTFCAIVLCRSVDAVALFELVLAHALHVVFHDLWRVGHALGVNDGSLHGEREPDGGCQRRCNKHTTVHDVFPLLVRPDAGTGGQSFALEAGKVTRLNQTFCDPANHYLITGGDCQGLLAPTSGGPVGKAMNRDCSPAGGARR